MNTNLSTSVLSPKSYIEYILQVSYHPKVISCTYCYKISVETLATKKDTTIKSFREEFPKYLILTEI